MISVTLRGIEQVDAAFGALLKNRFDLLRSIGLAPFAAELPGANAYDGNSEVTLS